MGQRCRPLERIPRDKATRVAPVVSLLSWSVASWITGFGGKLAWNRAHCVAWNEGGLVGQHQRTRVQTCMRVCVSACMRVRRDPEYGYK